MDINKGGKTRKIRETSREGERNRTFVSDSSPMKFPSISSGETGRNSRWPWNPASLAPAAWWLSPTCWLLCLAGQVLPWPVAEACSGLARGCPADFGLESSMEQETRARGRDRSTVGLPSDPRYAGTWDTPRTRSALCRTQQSRTCRAEGTDK